MRRSAASQPESCWLLPGASEVDAARLVESLELVLATIRELEAGPGDEVADRRGDERLAALRRGPTLARRRSPRCPEASRLEPAPLPPCATPARIWMPSGESECWMPSAQRIARAGPSKTAKKPSPAVSISSPRSGRAPGAPLRGAARRAATMPSRRAVRAVSVEPTMSVKRIVARTRSATGAGRAPVRNSSISSTSPSTPAQGNVLRPGSSTRRAEGMRSARSRATPTSYIGSSVLCSTIVGVWMAGNTSPTSVVATPEMMFRIAPGLPASRSRAPHHACITSSASGQKRRMLVPSPQRWMTSSMIALRRSSGTVAIQATA